MQWLNYHHLLYFWVVAREGGLKPAGEVLNVSHPTLSAQIRTLEERLGEKLFRKSGRRLTLTETGQTVFRYADEIFSLGQELLDTVQGRATGHPLRLNVGVVDVVPKLVVRRLLQPAFELSEPVRIVCYEDTHDKLLADLALHSLHVAISDAPVAPGSPMRAYNHPLGESGVTWFATSALAKKLRKGFPKSLDGAPVLLPLEHSLLRRSLNQWFERKRIRPVVVAEFEDSALLKVFAADGYGAFPAPTVVAKEMMQQYGVRKLGHADGVMESFFAISAERRLTHPAVLAITEAARHELFAKPVGSR
jgi:LysR family transcriptional activator of nhaA